MHFNIKQYIQKRLFVKYQLKTVYVYWLFASKGQPLACLKKKLCLACKTLNSKSQGVTGYSKQGTVQMLSVTLAQLSS